MSDGDAQHAGARSLGRRDFLRNAGLAGGAAALGGGLLAACAGKSPTSTFESVLAGHPGESGLDTVVVVCMENRSFDHYLGWLADDAEYLDAGRRAYGSRFHVLGRQHLRYRAPNGDEVPTSALVGNALEADPYRGCSHPIPGHGWNSGRAQRANGFIGLDTGNDEYAIGYYLGDQVPFYRQLARRFTVFDRWHAALLAGTFPNRQYLHAATSNGRKEDPIPLRIGVFKGETIWDRLQAARVPARYYYTDLPILTLWGERMYDRIHPVDDYFADAAAGLLPRFVMVDPGFRGPQRSDDHTYADIRMGQRFVRDILSAFVHSKHWERGAFVLLYDEWGGFFDHRPLPVVADERRSPVSEDDFGQTGFRVPALVASPRARRGFADHTLHTHTSVMRFLEWRFLGAPARGPGAGRSRWWLTTRDRHAHNLGDALGRNDPDPELHFDIDATLAPAGPACLQAGVAPPGSALGASGEWAADEQLQQLTVNRFPDAAAKPWILPDPLTPPSTAATTTTTGGVLPPPDDVTTSTTSAATTTTVPFDPFDPFAGNGP
jgi:phospholipase C